jgi:hypothetical protein
MKALQISDFCFRDHFELVLGDNTRDTKILAGLIKPLGGTAMLAWTN